MTECYVWVLTVEGASGVYQEASWTWLKAIRGIWGIAEYLPGNQAVPSLEHTIAHIVLTRPNRSQSLIIQIEQQQKVRLVHDVQRDTTIGRPIVDIVDSTSDRALQAESRSNCQALCRSSLWSFVFSALISPYLGDWIRSRTYARKQNICLHVSAFSQQLRLGDPS